MFGIKIFLGLIFLVLFSVSVHGACVNLTNGAMNNISVTTEICNGTFYPRDSQGYGAVVLWGNGAGKSLSCQSGTIINMNRTGVGIGTYTNADNWEIANCTIVNASTGVRIAGTSVNPVHNMTVKNMKIFYTYDLAGIFISDARYTKIQNNEIAYGINYSSAYNDVVHGIYCSGDTGVRLCEYINITGNYIHDNGGTTGGGSGVHINNVVNKTHNYILIIGNIIANHFGKAVDMNSCDYCIFENNDFINSTTAAVSIGTSDGNPNASRNSIFRYNRINQSAVNDSIRVDIRLFYNLSNIQIYGNNYTLNNTRIVYHTGFVSNVTINESNNVSFTYNSGAGLTYATVDMYHSNYKTFTLNSNIFYLNNLFSPGNDVKNNSIIIATDVNNYTIIVGENNAWSVGDYYTNYCATPELSNTPLNDYSPINNSMLISGLTYNASGQYYNFDGTGAIYFNLSSQITTRSMFADILIQSYDTSDAIGIIWGTSGGIRIDNSSKRLYCYVYNGTGYTTSVFPVALNNLQWYNVGCVVNNTHVTAYLNGTATSSNLLNGGFYNGTNLQIQIGRQDTARAITGYVDNAQYYTRSLSAGEVYQNYLRGRDGIPVNQTGQVLWLPFVNETIWRIPMSRNCTINDNFNGTLIYNGTGRVYLNSTINNTFKFLPVNGQTRYFLNNARIY